MHHHRLRPGLLRPAAVAAITAVALAVSSAAGSAVTRPPAASAMATAPASARPATAGARPVFLIDGEQAATGGVSQQQCVSVISQRTRAGSPARLSELSAGGKTYTLPAAAPAVAGKGTVTVTVTGTDISGHPAGDSSAALLFNADDSSRFDGPTSFSIFSNGVATFHVPAGHYWAVGDFIKTLPKLQSYDEYLDVLPQFTVSGNTTVHVAAAAATSRIQTVVPRRAIPQFSTFQLVRSAAAGPPVSLGWIVNVGGPKSPNPNLFVSPTTTRPSVGTLVTGTTQGLGTAAFPANSRYEYNVAYQSSGTIPAQRHVVRQATLATLHQRFYSAVRTIGLVNIAASFAASKICSLGAALFAGLHVPAQQTLYLSAHPWLSWQTNYIQNERAGTSGGQIGPSQVVIPGEQQTQDFGAYPLHPAPNVRLSTVAGLPPVQASATRAGDTLRLALTAFSDSVPGHLGQGTFVPVKAAASYQIEQNGKRVAGGTVPKFTGPFAAAATLSPAPSLIRFTLNTSEGAQLGPLSTATSTVWTWRSAHESGATLPPGWTCQPGGAVDRACDVQPMMTLRYAVVGLRQNGTAGAGQQVVRVTAGHLQLAPAAAITGAKVMVSFDGGKTWRAARITGHGGSYAAVFSAPAGALVTLRTSATDAAGAAITETITNAYQAG